MQASNSQSQKARGCYNLSPREGTFHQAVSWLQLLTTCSWDPGWLTSTRWVTAWDQLFRGDIQHAWDGVLLVHPENWAIGMREVIKTHGPPGTVCSPSIWSTEVLRPGKGTKPMPNQQRLSQNYVWVSHVEVQVSSGPLQGLWVQQTCIWHKPSWRRSPLTPP